MTRADLHAVVLTTLALLTCAAGAAQAAEITWTPEHPVAGEPVSVSVSDGEQPAAGAVVRAVYQPESEVPRVEDIGTTDDAGMLTWIPARGSVVRLSAVIPAADSTVVAQTLSVRFRGVPVMGLLVMLVAGIVLYGGVLRGFRLLSAAPPPSPPDT